MSNISYKETYKQKSKKKNILSGWEFYSHIQQLEGPSDKKCKGIWNSLPFFHLCRSLEGYLLT
jgi:hypothetical protein